MTLIQNYCQKSVLNQPFRILCMFTETPSFTPNAALKFSDMGADQSKQLENTLFNLKFSAKSLVRESKKCEKAEKEEKAKVKKAIQKGNTEGARIYAENAIRNKNQVMPVKFSTFPIDQYSRERTCFS